MKPRVYIETTIPSYLTARPTRDIVRTAHQQVTREWWELRRPEFRVFVSPAVIRECQGGDPTAAAARIAAIREAEVLVETEGARALAHVLVERLQIPRKAAIDGLHIALSAVHEMDYLLSWNCSHITNAALRTRIEAACGEFGLKAPILCTPLDLFPEEVDRG